MWDLIHKLTKCRRIDGYNCMNGINGIRTCMLLVLPKLIKCKYAVAEGFTRVMTYNS